MITYDLEADGLYEEASKVHCAVFKVNEEVYRLYDLLDIYVDQQEGDLQLNHANLINLILSDDGPIICHNQIGYDIFMLRKFFDIDLIALRGYESIVDTYVWSQALHPDRQLPKGCPTTIKKPDGSSKKVGPHGLEAWGYRVSRKKPQIFDWKTLDNNMMIRCEQDVLINEATYFMMLEERGDV